MKKHALLLLCGGMIALASCGDNENNSTQAQIDSAATARSAAMEAELKAKNDSLINEMAKMRADSAMKADSMAQVMAAGKKGATIVKSSSTVKHTTKTVSQPTGTKVTDRPGATDAKINGQQEKPKSVSDRPGATEVNR